MDSGFTIPWKNVRRGLFRRSLLRWYIAHARVLPWRHTPNPYRIWVSEIMLQQTRVSAVIPYYQRFIKRFPTVQALASAEIEEVLALWSGLGYYRRIRDLHQAANIVARKHHGIVPDNRKELLLLPGIGAYTAGAILSLAYDLPEPVLDGNVARVLCRIFAIRQDPRARSTVNRLWQLASWMLPLKQSSSFNQALMELGALCCLPRSPQCTVCPVRIHCLAEEQGLQAFLPVPRKPAAKSKERLAAVVLIHKNRILLLKKEQGALVSGLWELPLFSRPAPDNPDPGDLAANLKVTLNTKASPINWVGRVRHNIMQRDIQLDIYSATAKIRRVSKTEDNVESVWILPDEISQYGVSSLSLKALRLWQKTFDSKSICRSSQQFS